MQIGKGKQGVIIGEYGCERKATLDGNKLLGWIEPACDSPDWIIWFTAKGDAIIYTDRAATGAVPDAEPLKLKARRKLNSVKKEVAE